MIFLIALLFILLVLVVLNIRIVPQATSYVIERLGAYYTTWDVGLHVKIPFLDRIALKASMKEQVVDFPPQPVITSDNVTIEIDTIVYFRITDPKLFAYGVEYPMSAIENLTATTLRNIIGDLELDGTLTSREIINSKIRVVLDEATDPWGIKITRVEVKNILPPKDIQTAMEKQMRAERERREAILKAEGEKKSAILIAEGQKASKILEAEAEKQAKILEAEARKESQIRLAEGESEAIKMVQEATAKGIQSILAAFGENATADDIIKLKSLEAFKEAANGNATKIIIPSDIPGIAGLASALPIIESTKENKENQPPKRK